MVSFNNLTFFHVVREYLVPKLNMLNQQTFADLLGSKKTLEMFYSNSQFSPPEVFFFSGFNKL